MLTITYSYGGTPAQTISISDTATAKQQTTAIQTALDAVASHGGGTVALSAGLFTITGTGRASDGALRIGSNTEFSGHGMGETVLKLADGSTSVTGMIRTNSGQTLQDGTVSTVANVNIHGLTLDGNKSHTTGSTDGFYCGPRPGTAQYDSNINLDHVEIANVSRYGFDPHEQTTGLTISNSIAHDNGVDGFTIDFCSNVHLTNNLAYGNGRHGFNIVTGSSDVVMVGNDAHDNAGSGIVVQTGNNEIREWTHGVSISGGAIEHNGRDGITLKQTSDVTIDHVIITGNSADAIGVYGVTSANLHDNAITNVAAGRDAVHLANYVQEFGDTDVLNDRFIATTGVIINGVAATVPDTSQGVTTWSYVITAGDDVVTGSDGRDTIAAGSGNDTVFGKGGDDALYGNDGNDILDGGAGADKLYGGVGNDSLKYTQGLDTLDGGVGFDTVDFSKFGAAVYVNMSASGVDAWTSGTSSVSQATAATAIADLIAVESIKGTSFADLFIGNTDANAFDGGGGFDVIDGGAGNDTINGAAGNDTLRGGAGNDTLTGGTGSDVFSFDVLWGTDTITDFYHSRDKIDFIGDGTPHSISDLVVAQAGTDTSLSFGGQSIVLLGVNASTITASDFLFH